MDKWNTQCHHYLKPSSSCDVYWRFGLCAHDRPILFVFLQFIITHVVPTQRRCKAIVLTNVCTMCRFRPLHHHFALHAISKASLDSSRDKRAFLASSRINILASRFHLVTFISSSFLLVSSTSAFLMPWTPIVQYTHCPSSLWTLCNR